MVCFMQHLSSLLEVKIKRRIVGNGHVKGATRLMKLKIRRATDKIDGTKMITSLK